jgi:hypothetical protein
MAYVNVMSPCYCCGNVFSYHPHLVPSVRVNAQGQADTNGEREPICKTCVDRVNPLRVANGLEPITPHPRAYGLCEEHEL